MEAVTRAFIENSVSNPPLVSSPPQIPPLAAVERLEPSACVRRPSRGGRQTLPQLEVFGNLLDIFL